MVFKRPFNSQFKCEGNSIKSVVDNFPFRQFGNFWYVIEADHSELIRCTAYGFSCATFFKHIITDVNDADHSELVH